MFLRNVRHLHVMKLPRAHTHTHTQTYARAHAREFETRGKCDLFKTRGSIKSGFEDGTNCRVRTILRPPRPAVIRVRARAVFRYFSFGRWFTRVARRLRCCPCKIYVLSSARSRRTFYDAKFRINIFGEITIARIGTVKNDRGKRTAIYSRLNVRKPVPYDSGGPRGVAEKQNNY